MIAVSDGGFEIKKDAQGNHAENYQVRSFSPLIPLMSLYQQSYSAVRSPNVLDPDCRRANVML